MAQPTVEFDRSLLGKDFPAGSFTITKEQVLAYCRIIGETNPLYLDEQEARRRGHPALLAPPLMCPLFARDLDRPQVKLNFGRMRMHAGQALESFHPIYAGDTITASVHLADVYTKTGRSGTMVFIVWETVFVNQQGERVAVSRDSHMVRE
ncbi:MAG: MaoC family dehydratase N-terminal domain-containing protein [Chloroflexi bacterium]|nr:MaoC family dehydratase N-terminal domain-containing protein [Chloroflexota bacterium]